MGFRDLRTEGLGPSGLRFFRVGFRVGLGLRV